MKSYLLIFSFLLIANSSFGQDILKGSKINWQDLEAAIDQNPNKKNFFVFIYADWCDYCQKTAKTTLQDPEFIDLVNNQFIPVNLNANSYETIHILNTDFIYDEESGYHGLPIVLLEGNMELPGFVFMTPEFTMISKFTGVQDDLKSLNRYLNYIGTNSYKQKTWDDYQSSLN